MPPSLATTAIVGVTSGTLAYAKGYLDGADQHRHWAEIERQWRLLWDKYMMFLRQLVTGNLRTNSVEYTGTILKRLSACAGDMGPLLTMAFPNSKDQVSNYVRSLASYVNEVNTILSSSNPISDERCITSLRNASQCVVESVCRIDAKLFNAEEANALFGDNNRYLEEMIRCELKSSKNNDEQERIKAQSESLEIFTKMQNTCGDLATFFATAINMQENPISRWF